MALGVGLLSGCARVSDTAKNLFVSSTPAVAMVGTQLMQGEMQVYSDYSGVLTLASEGDTGGLQSCSGRLPNNSTFGREIDLRCSDGTVAHLRLSLRSDMRGYAYGGEGTSAVSLAFGLEPAQATALLHVPKGQLLVFSEGRYQLTRPAGNTAMRPAQLPPVEAAGAPSLPDASPAPDAAPATPVAKVSPSEPNAGERPAGATITSTLGNWFDQARKWLSSSNPSASTSPATAAAIAP
jgi:hypothetical protein